MHDLCRLNGYADATAMRLAPYESANFTQEVTDAWKQLEPLYQQIHAYIRHKLAKRSVLELWGYAGGYG